MMSSITRSRDPEFETLKNALGAYVSYVKYYEDN